MKKILFIFSVSSLISVMLLIPFMIMELVNRREFHEGFPYFLFFFLWILLLAFISILITTFQNIGIKGFRLISFKGLILRVPALILIAWMLIGIIIDQIPCFLGVSNCD